MTEQEITKIIETVEENEDFGEQVVNAKEPEEVLDLMNEIGISITMDEAKGIIEGITKKREQEELTEEDLAIVNGGCAGLSAFLIKTALVLGGIGAAVLVGGVILMIAYSKAKKRR